VCNSLHKIKAFDFTEKLEKPIGNYGTWEAILGKQFGGMAVPELPLQRHNFSTAL
jgi:hypothetical protein